MFGDKLLISPKRGDPSEPVLEKTIEHTLKMYEAGQKATTNSDVMSGGQLVEVYLPPTAIWYNYYSK